MLDAYCKHMGTHLAKNTSAMLIVAEVGGKHVEGDSIDATAGATIPRDTMIFRTTTDPAPSRPQFALSCCR